MSANTNEQPLASLFLWLRNRHAEVMAAVTQIRLDTLDDVLHADAEGRVAAMNMIARRFQQ